MPSMDENIALYTMECGAPCRRPMGQNRGSMVHEYLPFAFRQLSRNFGLVICTNSRTSGFSAVGGVRVPLASKSLYLTSHFNSPISSIHHAQTGTRALGHHSRRLYNTRDTKTLMFLVHPYHNIYTRPLVSIMSPMLRVPFRG